MTRSPLILALFLAMTVEGAVKSENGGLVVREEPGSGRVILVNGQTRVPQAVLDKAVSLLQRRVRINIHSGVDGEDRGRAFVRVKDDPKDASAILVSPDELWASVNVAKFAADGAAADVVARRVEVAVIRATFILCGGGGSQVPSTMLEPMPSLADYDGVKPGRIPVEPMSRIQRFLRKLGVAPIAVMDYQQACMEGIAPAPTNAEQRAIWDEVHTPPKNPMKIEFDPKKGR